MSRLFYHVMQDNSGNLLFDVSGTMRLAGTGTVATIYGDEALTVPIANPMTNHPSFGSFKCFLGVGDYDFYMAKSGYTFETLTGVQGSGTMADQNASAVAITGGSAILGPVVSPGFALVVDADGMFRGKLGVGNIPPGADYLSVNGSTRLDGTLTTANRVALNSTLVSNQICAIKYTKDTNFGLGLRPTDNDAGVASPVLFLNVAGSTIGSIGATSTAVSYNVSSDARLKHTITPLTGALDVVRALRPITHLWKADDSRGVGFLAHEVQQVIADGVITGEPDALEEDGSIRPQMIDYSRLVPYLTAALKEALERIDVLTARLDAAGA